MNWKHNIIVFLKYTVPLALIILAYFVIQRFLPAGSAGVLAILNGFSKTLLDKITEKKDTIQKRQQVYTIIQEKKINVDKKITAMSNDELDTFIRSNI